MNNPIVAAGTFGPVYKRKIHVYYKRQGGLCYGWSTNAYKTCRDALKAAKAVHPDVAFVANFAKD